MSYPPPQYGSGPQYGGPLTHPQGTTILVLGILSLVVCGLLGPFAWNMGNKALREIDSSGQIYENRGMVQAGKICGMIATILWGVMIVFYVIFFVIFGAMMATSGY
ncbi:DUF4190 domain-containing protein [Nonomuraea sp. NPDC050663]|uniref:Putative membrane protein n=1 Tax=Nonomuraea soli TaxID=1032476 RepID=A0A7W0CGA1_9ACTN|nr:DUF4190 domain-containing protein [Nonomuraea soli]MBA2890652.1 putative membrane protein [Nonomuraea soli]